MGVKEKVKEQVATADKVVLNNQIIVYNDDVNTFDHVIETLMRVCNHIPEQAEQCSLIIHYVGKCTVKTGKMKELLPQCSSLLEAGLSAEII